MRLVLTGIVGLVIAGSAMAQSWTASYDAGLKAAKDGKWSEARASFLKAKALRPDDVDKPTNLPGPVTEQRRWRNGSPYSPNFLAAYSSYRLALEAKQESAAPLYTAAASEFEALINKKQVSKESVYFLYAIYGRLNQNDKRQALANKIAEPTWKVDTEVLAAEETAAINSGGTTTTSGGGVIQTVNAGSLGSSIPNSAVSGGPVPVVPTKFALIVSNGDNRLPGLALQHATADGELLKEALITNAGYDAANIEVVNNASAAALSTAAKNLAARMPAEGTLFFFYTGGAAHVDGRDWFAGPNTEIATDTSTMVRKTEIYQPFFQKGVSVFAFYQTPRTAVNGKVFGDEELKAGRVSQMQATMAGDTIYSYFKGGKVVGIFADAVATVLGDLHSNQVPITEFGWQVFYKIRRGGLGDSGGGSRQTPTLPVLQFLSSNAKF
ncbi:MAG TPA: hypothetical protein VK171_12985 [Fimbriimonas sp.]|nr:hypothetical protein [Fimbriimonas sp.]